MMHLHQKGIGTSRNLCEPQPALHYRFHMRLTQRELQDLDFWISEQGQRNSFLVVVLDKMYSQVVKAWDSCASSSRHVNHDREVIQIVLEFQGCSHR